MKHLLNSLNCEALQIEAASLFSAMYLLFTFVNGKTITQPPGWFTSQTKWIQKDFY